MILYVYTETMSISQESTKALNSAIYHKELFKLKNVQPVCFYVCTKW